MRSEDDDTKVYLGGSLRYIAAVTVGFSLYAGAKATFFPELSGWVSQATSILVVAVLSTLSMIWFGRRARDQLLREHTEREQGEEELRHLTFHDPLTDLPNRTLLMQHLEQALTRAQQRGGEVATLFIDLDDLKAINDSLGHHAGDHLLVSVSRRLRALLRQGDTIAHFGGDENDVLLEDTDVAEASRVAQRLVERMRMVFTVDGRELIATCSVGIALGGSAGEQPSDLLRRADLALHAAKTRGKNRHESFEEAMEVRVIERLEMEHSLRQTTDWEEEFVVHYHPFIALESGRVVGFEALVRWNHPWRGLLLSGEFLALAEQIGVIVGVGSWVLREVCRQTREWHERHPRETPLTVSVNLSASQLTAPGLVEDVADVLKTCGLEPSSLILEVTEGAMMKDMETSVAILRRLKDLGVRIAVDDFGKDYSSLFYLKRLPVDILKIDRSLVDGLGTEDENEGIVQVVVELARTLGLMVVAEGVENREQLEKLKEMGCELAQGFYFREPLPAEVAGDLLAVYNYQ